MRGLVLFSALCVMFCTSASAWSARGHELIARVAYERLTPAARAAVDELVSEDFSASPGCPIRSFTEAAVWSDCVRAIPSYRNQSSWHYDNIPLCVAAAYDTYCAGGDCGTAAIARAERTLRNPRAAPRDRQRALARLVHMIGDIHQPLHAVNNNDRGGNDVRVRLTGGWSGSDSARNLHAVWDGALVDFALGADDARARASIAQLAAANARSWSTGDPRAWAAEAHERAFTVAYGRLQPPVACGVSTEGVIVIDRAYADASAGIVQTQMARASARLAVALNQQLD